MARTIWLSGAAFIGLTTIAYPAYAADAATVEYTAQTSVQDDAEESTGGLNVIIVTAQRRQESVQDIPIATFDPLIGTYQEYTAHGSVGVPLSDSFAAKVSGYYQDSRGYIKNTSAGERLNYNDGWGVRFGMRGDLSENAKWTGATFPTNITGQGSRLSGSVT